MFPGREEKAHKVYARTGRVIDHKMAWACMPHCCDLLSREGETADMQARSITYDHASFGWLCIMRVSPTMHYMGPYVCIRTSIQPYRLYHNDGTVGMYWLARGVVLACVPVHGAEISEQEIASLNTNVDPPAAGDMGVDVLLQPMDGCCCGRV
jgi:hypothetical protein